jgi:homoserine dehydrogenase
MRQVNLGIIGGGTVGGGVFDALQRNGNLLSSRIGVRVHVQKIAVRSLQKNRVAKIPKNLLTTDWREVVCDPEINLVAELIGGTTIAREVVLTSLKLGKPVVTARNFLPPQKNSARIFTTKPASPAAFRLSNRCAKDLSAIASTRFTASSTAPAIMF